MKKILIIFIIALVSLFLYGRYIEVNIIKTNYYDLPANNISKSFKDLKILHFSDLLYEPSYEKNLDVIMKMQM